MLSATGTQNNLGYARLVCLVCTVTLAYRPPWSSFTSVLSSLDPSPATAIEGETLLLCGDFDQEPEPGSILPYPLGVSGWSCSCGNGCWRLQVTPTLPSSRFGESRTFSSNIDVTLYSPDLRKWTTRPDLCGKSDHLPMSLQHDSGHSGPDHESRPWIGTSSHVRIWLV